MSAPTHAQVTFNEFGLPVATAFGDIYFNNENGLAETNYVFLQHNDLPARWQTDYVRPFVIAESGFGTGLNLLACWQLLLEQAPAELKLHFISFEKYPLRPDDLRRALAAFPQLSDLAAELLAVYPPAEPGCHRRILAQGRIVLDLWVGAIDEQIAAWLPHSEQQVDAWFLDGFAPDKNPDMWQPELYEAMVQSAAPGATFATFTAAGKVRRGLLQAGVNVQKAKGFGVKREMLFGELRGAIAPHAPVTNNVKQVTIIGGGIAAACLAHELSGAGVSTEIISCGVADAASGNPQGAVYPLLHAERSPLAEYFSLAFGYATHFYQHYTTNHWHATGVVQLAYTEARQQRYEKIASARTNGGPGYDPAMVQFRSTAATQQLWQELPAYPALHYPTGGWLAPAAVVTQLFQGHKVKPSATLTRVSRSPEDGSSWQLEFADGQLLERDTVILACGAGLKQLLHPFGLQLQNVRGQVTQVEASAVSAQCPLVVCYKGYFTPVSQGRHCVGATYDRDSEDLTLRPADQQENLGNLIDNLAPVSWPKQLRPCADRAAIRNTTKDHLPVVGELKPGLWLLGGLGSRGFTAAPLAASALTAALVQRPLPLPAQLWQRLQPQRLCNR
ncbi:bifunctional tRNA (5-methylaminomethyl-2-thiouridine)(34)-methyltransferase MnmD/FAD-dependent 5-carboxymethylaminomethyl-2-thiouridine(34) oxidoreductase MnmC [Pseudidiomarina halophila]|uniref:bifunctional tRNA (5-methylaminomethyl-2-thiouridine)(34)-methyltransferase MnmD/FAD-dependent 5-carboxymethylaminomethyl-2-thiouridine(34) oxidoreductase MnmC n=1 Tax=Pseudidiomarina halophila TaxID=1449799 RepID=UPI001300A3D4|nr:bifunctional tRNA (5-methylaminomethyl-2-thiouridine)(34)-methyltransferase MnmD/FAD-dependent 5-carboxymethylaminomethyl-2-thiouridine(34) oxidoreductase MnmC [Pseudidiomarina halophila]